MPKRRDLSVKPTLTKTFNGVVAVFILDLMNCCGITGRRLDEPVFNPSMNKREHAFGRPGIATKR